jgi:hypothetical protein
MLPYSCKGRVYLNFPGGVDDDDELVQSFPAEQALRLSMTKAKYDPRNLFRYNSNIIPAI